MKDNRVDENTPEELAFALDFYNQKFEETKDRYWQNEAKRIVYKMKQLTDNNQKSNQNA